MGAAQRGLCPREIINIFLTFKSGTVSIMIKHIRGVLISTYAANSVSNSDPHEFAKKAMI